MYSKNEWYALYRQIEKWMIMTTSMLKTELIACRMDEKYRSLKGDVPVKWERIYSVEIIGATIILYKLTYLIDN